MSHMVSLSALYLSLKRLSEILDGRTFQVGPEVGAVRQVASHGFVRASLVHALEPAAVDWLQRAARCAASQRTQSPSFRIKSALILTLDNTDLPLHELFGNRRRIQVERSLESFAPPDVSACGPGDPRPPTR